MFALDVHLALTWCQHPEQRSEFRQNHTDRQLVPSPLPLPSELLQHYSHISSTLLHASKPTQSTDDSSIADY